MGEWRRGSDVPEREAGMATATGSMGRAESMPVVVVEDDEEGGIGRCEGDDG